MHFVKIFLTFHLLILNTFSTSNKCLVSISVPDISASQANISWSYICDRDNLIFKIYYDHVEYRACQEDINKAKKHRQRKKKVYGEANSVMIDNLEPYSLYNFEVAAIPSTEGSPRIETKTVKKKTKESSPQVVIKDLTDKTQDTNDRITVIWESPDKNDCEYFHSEPGYLLYKLSGSSEWNHNFFKEGNLSLSTTNLTISNLLPFSLYKMELYMTSKEGQFSSPAMETEILTGASQPHRPCNLSISDNLLQWSPPFPPTGQLQGYQVRWRIAGREESDWEISDYLTGEEVFCHDNLACYNIVDVEDNQKYSFQVRAFNKDVKSGSEWSDMVYFMETDNGVDMKLVMTVIIILTVSLLLCLVIIFLLHKFNIWSRLRGFKQTKSDDDYTVRPIIKNSDSLTRLTMPRAVSPPVMVTTPDRSPSSEVELRNLTTTSQRASLSRRSCLDPLPPVPGKEEPVYDELVKKPSQPLDEDNYLAPNPARVASVESLDEEGYLRPNYHRHQLLDTRSPVRECLPPIPPVSYSSQDQLQS